MVDSAGALASVPKKALAPETLVELLRFRDTLVRLLSSDDGSSGKLCGAGSTLLLAALRSLFVDAFGVFFPTPARQRLGCGYVLHRRQQLNLWS
jgi:hypothetical protein